MSRPIAPVLVELLSGVEGPCLVVNGYRVAGPKPWGGGRVVREWKVHPGEIRAALRGKHPSTARLSRSSTTRARRGT